MKSSVEVMNLQAKARNSTGQHVSLPEMNWKEQRSDKWQRLIPLIRNGCCIFVGAGIPKLIGFPTWEEMVKQMLEYTWESKGSFNIKKFELSEKIELDDMISKEKLSRVLTFCKGRFKKNGRIEEYYKKLEELFNDKEKCENIRNDGYAELAKLGVRSFFVQTNVDRSLEIYIKKAKSVDVFVNVSLPSVKSISASSMIYLHGVITNKSSLILTDDEYNAFYQTDINFTTFVQELFATHDVIFLGYGLNDKEILDNIIKSGNGRARFLAVGKTVREETKNKMFAEYLSQHYGVEIIEYDIEKGYEEITGFLRSLNYRLMEPPSLIPPSEDRSRT